MRRVSYIRVSAFVCVVLGLVGVAGDHRVSAQTAAPGPSQFEIGAFRHGTHAEPQTSLELPNTNEFPSETETVSPPPPTRSSFMATWPGVTGAKGYLLDVSTSSSFDSFVDGYHDLDVGDVTGRVVTGLSRDTTYYYRVRAYNATAPTSYSETIAMTTEPTTGLTIHPTFDSSITGNPNAAAIQAMINRTIAIYESLFSDPITIQIRFRYATTGPDGSCFTTWIGLAERYHPLHQYSVEYLHQRLESGCANQQRQYRERQLAGKCIVPKYQAGKREWSSSWIEYAASDVRKRLGWTGWTVRWDRYIEFFQAVSV